MVKLRSCFTGGLVMKLTKLKALVLPFGLICSSILFQFQSAEAKLVYQDVPDCPNCPQAERQAAERINGIVNQIRNAQPQKQALIIPDLLNALPVVAKGKSFPIVMIISSPDDPSAWGGAPLVEDNSGDLPVRSALIAALSGKNATKAARVLFYCVPAAGVPLTGGELKQLRSLTGTKDKWISMCLSRIHSIFPSSPVAAGK
jgi:hypothetical protein